MVEKKKFSMHWRLLTILVVILVINLPLVSAIQISGITESDLTETGVVIEWDTDEEADSFVYYGDDEVSLTRVESDANAVTDHSVAIDGLIPGTDYYYYVMSNGEVENNSGSNYNFQTISTEEETGEEEAVSDESSDSEETEGEIVTTTSGSLSLSVEHPEIVAGEYFDINGSTFANAEVRVYVNGGYHAKQTAAEDGTFVFVNVPLNADESNVLEVESTTTDSQVQTYSGIVYSDNTHPEIALEPYSEIALEDHVTLKGAVSEECSIEIFVNENSIHTSEGTSFSEELHLDEGINEITIEATDRAGWVAREEIEIDADTQPPDVEAEFEKGNEYYQNRAVTNIHGTTEPGSVVYLFIYRPLSYQYNPDFRGPWLAVEVGEDGNFTFENINFETEPLSFDDFEIQQVPSGLEGVSIYPIESVSQAQEWTYNVYLISVDKSGKSGYWQDVVTVNTCYSSNFDFQITSIAKFQQPMRLNPDLIEDGREVATAVFNLSYLGGGIAERDTVTGEENRDAFQINSVRFEKACTQSMMDDEKFGVGCAILPNEPQVLQSSDRTAYYLNWNLYTTEGLSEVDDDFWNDFKQRQVVFPLKVSVNYQEYDSLGNLGESKTQTSCYDLGYFVDIPVDSEKLIPDWMANEGIKALNGTIAVIDKILPVLEKVILVTGITCFVSIGVKTVIRFARIFTSKAEYLTTRNKDEAEQCPLDQTELYLDTTREKWDELASTHPGAGNLPSDYNDEDKLLNEKCENTANLWKAEEALDQAYRWTCDRFLCRPVPARWTETKDEEQIEAAIATQKGCAVTAGCIPLREVENCGNYVENTQPGIYQANTAEIPSSGVCWERFDDENTMGNTGTISGTLYYYDENADSSIVSQENGIYRLKKVSEGNGLSNNLGGKSTILVYQESNGGYCGAPDTTCKAVCSSPQNPGYKAVTDGYSVDSGTVGEVLTGSGDEVEADFVVDPYSSSGSCYRVEEGDRLVSPGGRELEGNMIAAGHTSDCFVADDGYKYQCVCESDQKKSTYTGVREALKKENEVAEKFSYRQDRLYTESKGFKGTHYSELRYYDGRDLSGAFGLDYLPDYAVPSDLKKKTVVNPHTQHISAFQTVCLTGIRARLVMLRSILDGLRRCIEEAKYTGFHDAGMCKTLFSQHVCGLIYKLIASFSGQCSPLSLKDANKGNQTTAAELFGAGTESVYDSMQYSIDDLQSDYGNSALNEYFASGVQGVAESICMAAFGFDWPMGFDFIEDVAYSVPMKSSVLVFPAFRELTNYNPQTLTAQFNYEVGTVIFPGCKIASYQTYLKCVGPEDMSHPGVDCGSQGCDCLNVGSTSPLESERIHYLDGGRGSNLEQGSMVELPIESPQKVDKHFRYDHVVVELQLDPYENPDSCFDEGYKDGKFYFPITDASAPGVASCQVEASTGQYSCPELAGLFYGDGLAYLQDPYIACYDKNTNTYVDCDTPNMLLLGDEIKVKVHMNTDGENYCLRLKTSAAGIDDANRERSYEIPAGAAGFMSPVFEIGTVSEEMLDGSDAGLTRDSSESNTGCPSSIDASSTSGTVNSNQEVKFGFSRDGDDYVLDGITFATGIDASGDYKVEGNKLVRESTGDDKFGIDEINNVVFTFGNMQVSGVLGSATGSGACVYNTQQGRESSSSTNVRRVSVTADLLEPNSLGSCYGAKDRVDTVALGRSSHTENIQVQKEHEVQEATSEIYTYFDEGRYPDVMQLAIVKMAELPGYLDEAVGIYYYTAAVIAQLGNNWNSGDYKPLFDRFFLRQDAEGYSLPPFDEGDIQTAEFQKIRAYMCEIGKESSQINLDDYSRVSYGCD